MGLGHLTSTAPSAAEQPRTQSPSGLFRPLHGYAIVGFSEAVQVGLPTSIARLHQQLLYYQHNVLSREVRAMIPSPAHRSLGPCQLQYKTSPGDSCCLQLPLGRTDPAHPARLWGPLLIMPFYKALQSPSWFISRLLRKVARGVSVNNKGPLFVRRLRSQMRFL